MKVRYVPYELLFEVFRECRDESKPYIEFGDVKEVEQFLYDCMNDGEDIHFFSLYGKLSMTTYPREYKDIMIDIISEVERFDDAR